MLDFALDSALIALVTANQIHGNSLRALCKYLFNISDTKINELEIPTGNPLIIDFDNQLKIQKYYYLNVSRAKNIIFNQ